MGKEAVFTMKLEPELRDEFMAAAKRDDRPASQIVREFMRDFVQQDREYVEFLRGRLRTLANRLKPALAVPMRR